MRPGGHYHYPGRPPLPMVMALLNCTSDCFHDPTLLNANCGLHFQCAAAVVLYSCAITRNTLREDGAVTFASSHTGHLVWTTKILTKAFIDGNSCWVKAKWPKWLVPATHRDCEIPASSSMQHDVNRYAGSSTDGQDTVCAPCLSASQSRPWCSSAGRP